MVLLALVRAAWHDRVFGMPPWIAKPFLESNSQVDSIADSDMRRAVAHAATTLDMRRAAAHVAHAAQSLMPPASGRMTTMTSKKLMAMFMLIKLRCQSRVSKCGRWGGERGWGVNNDDYVYDDDDNAASDGQTANMAMATPTPMTADNSLLMMVITLMAVMMFGDDVDMVTIAKYRMVHDSRWHR